MCSTATIRNRWERTKLSEPMGANKAERRMRLQVLQRAGLDGAYLTQVSHQGPGARAARRRRERPCVASGRCREDEPRGQRKVTYVC